MRPSTTMAMATFQLGRRHGEATVATPHPHPTRESVVHLRGVPERAPSIGNARLTARCRTQSSVFQRSTLDCIKGVHRFRYSSLSCLGKERNPTKRPVGVRFMPSDHEELSGAVSLQNMMRSNSYAKLLRSYYILSQEKSTNAPVAVLRW